MSSTILAHDVVVAPGATPSRMGMLVHGILGSRRNWGSIARRLAQRFEDWRFVVVDLRCHGDSRGQLPPHTVEACAADLAALAAHLGEEPAWISGHSFGGKVALTYARDYAAELETAWVLDSPPGPARPGGGTSQVERVMATLSEIAIPIAGRRELKDALMARHLSSSLADWMTTNLKERDDGGFEWAFDLEGARELLASYARLDLWPVLEHPPSGVDLHFVRGELSDRWHSDDETRLAALAAGGTTTVHVLEGAGHWVHSDNPKGLLELFFASLG